MGEGGRNAVGHIDMKGQVMTEGYPGGEDMVYHSFWEPITHYPFLKPLLDWASGETNCVRPSVRPYVCTSLPRCCSTGFPIRIL
jgi:hypothetical protein